MATCNIVTRSLMADVIRQSSLNTKYLGAQTVYASDKSENSTTKGSGNLRKKGSGGNSYAAYLSKKDGKTRDGFAYEPDSTCTCGDI